MQRTCSLVAKSDVRAGGPGELAGVNDGSRSLRKRRVTESHINWAARPQARGQLFGSSTPEADYCRDYLQHPSSGLNLNAARC